MNLPFIFLPPCGRKKDKGLLGDSPPVAYAHRQRSTALRARRPMLAHVKKKEKRLTATLGWLTHTGREVPPSGLNPNSPLPILKPLSLKPQALSLKPNNPHNRQSFANAAIR